METLNQIAQGFGYIMMTAMVLFGLFIWRMMKKAPNYDNMEENRIMGLTDRIKELEEEKDKLKGQRDLGAAKLAERDIELANIKITLMGAKETLMKVYDEQANLLTENGKLQKELLDYKTTAKENSKAITEIADANNQLRYLNTRLEERNKKLESDYSEIAYLYCELDNMVKNPVEVKTAQIG